MDHSRSTSFCGLWCGDCIPANEKLYDTISELKHLLVESGFRNYAEYKSERVPEFKDYDVFLRVLNAFEKLRCLNYCREGPCSEAGCAKECKIRLCSIENGFEGCWDCDTYNTCEQISQMERLHPDIKSNLTQIKAQGIDKWKEYRGRHYRWSEQNPSI